MREQATRCEKSEGAAAEPGRGGPGGAGGRSPVPDKEVSVSREWHGRVLPQGNRFPEVLAQLSHHQLLHGAGDGRALEIQKVTGVGHVQDGPRPAATEVGPGGIRRGAGRLLLPPPPPAPRCPEAQQSAAFCAKTHALPRLSFPPPRSGELQLGILQAARRTHRHRAGRRNSPQAAAYVNKALCSNLQPASVLPTQPAPPPHGNAARRTAARWSPAAGRLLPPLALPRSNAGPLPRPSVPQARRRCQRLRPAVPDPPHHTHTGIACPCLPPPPRPRTATGVVLFLSVRQMYGRLEFLLKVVFNLHAASD